ncbi:lupus La protein homolog [Glandiceps talaboti]
MTANGAKSEKPSFLESKIIRQIEYYFGDVNLRRDKFLQEKTKEDEGWVTLETLITFNRLKQMSTDFEVIVAALKKSTSGLLEISEDKTKIRRCEGKPVPEDSDNLRADIKSRSVYCKGFPNDASLDDIQEFLDKHGKVSTIQMRKTLDTKEFKGSVFTTFDSVEDAKKFVDAESIKYGETETIRLLKADYFRKKQEERKAAKKEEKMQKYKEKDEKEDGDEPGNEYQPGCILYFSGATDQTSREDLHAVFDKHGNVRWIDFTRGETEGYIRFDGGEAQSALDKVKEGNDGKIVVNEQELTTKVLEGEEEKNKWLEIREQQRKVRDMKRTGRKRKPFKGRHARDGPRRKGTKFEGKKTVFESDDDDDEDDSGDEDTAKKESQPVKRAHEDDAGTTEEPASKQVKTETAVAE